VSQPGAAAAAAAAAAAGLQVRQSAGLLLKNNLKQQYASLSEDFRNYIKVWLCGCVCGCLCVLGARQRSSGCFAAWVRCGTS
jgi:hypothetical protein